MTRSCWNTGICCVMPHTMSKGTKVRTVRIDDALWDAAKAKAKSNNDDLSAIMRAALQDYVDHDET